MKRLRVEQRKDESPDIFAMRAFAIAMPHMNLNALSAFARWIFERANADYKAKSEAAVVDGLTCVEWVKDHRSRTGCLLQEAKAEWDRRVAAQAAAFVRAEREGR